MGRSDEIVNVGNSSLAPTAGVDGIKVAEALARCLLNK